VEALNNTPYGRESAIQISVACQGSVGELVILSD
jgi:hypothetical protein